LDPTTVALIPGTGFFPIWGSDEPVTLPSDGSAPFAPRWFPPATGFRFALLTLGPDTVTKVGADGLDMDAALADLRAKLPGLMDVVEPDSELHATDTVDFVVLVSGEVWLELDDGAQVHLHAGDCVVQNGTRHTWRNTSPKPCVMVIAIIGAERRA
jgi:mannose-6-phosphate isomerase-like protein (cupin superfamily)